MVSPLLVHQLPLWTRLRLPPRAILDRLSQVRRFDRVAAGQVSDRAGQFEDAVVGPGAHLKLVHGRAEEALPRVIDLAEGAHLGGAHTCTCAASAGVSALDIRPEPSKRWRWRSRAASTRDWMAAEGSPRRSSDSFSYSTRGTSMWMSIDGVAMVTTRAGILANTCSC
jgi:hypothetical protein